MKLGRWMAWPMAAALMLALVLAAGGCAERDVNLNAGLEVRFESQRQWTAVAFSSQERVFVSYPRWGGPMPSSVDERLETGAYRPYPDDDWNRWDRTMDPARHFVCVQSIVMDNQDHLWVLDTGNPGMQGVIEGAPKLVRIDTRADTIARIYPFMDEVLEESSYLNDVRIDLRRQTAYLTDSHSPGLVVLDLASGVARRVLENHPSTHAEEITLVVHGDSLVRGGEPMRVHADGIALDPVGHTLYYHALTGRTLYRIDTESLRDASLSEEELGARVDKVARTGGADGMIAGRDGKIYLTSVERGAVTRFIPGAGTVQTVVENPELLRWPDSFAFDREGRLHVLISQISFPAGPEHPYRVFRIDF